MILLQIKRGEVLVYGRVGTVPRRSSLKLVMATGTLVGRDREWMFSKKAYGTFLAAGLERMDDFPVLMLAPMKTKLAAERSWPLPLLPLLLVLLGSSSSSSTSLPPSHDSPLVSMYRTP